MTALSPASASSPAFAVSAGRRGAFAEAAKLRTLEPHHDAVEAPCPLATDCGGCKTQSLAYAAQIQHKYLEVRDLLVNFGKFDPKNLVDAEGVEGGGGGGGEGGTEGG